MVRLTSRPEECARRLEDNLTFTGQEAERGRPTPAFHPVHNHRTYAMAHLGVLPPSLAKRTGRPRTAWILYRIEEIWEEYHAQTQNESYRNRL